MLGSSLFPMQIVLAAMLIVASYSIQGTVALDSGAAIDAPIFVQLVKGANAPIDCVYTSLGGNFNFQDVPAGVYHIRIQHEGFEDASQYVEVPIAGQALVVSLRRRRSASVVDEPVLGDKNRVTVRQLATPPEAIRHYQKASDDLEQGQTDRAIRHLRRAIEIAPGFLEAIYGLSDLLYGNERYAEAEQVLSQAVKAVPSEGRLYLFLARTLVRQHKFKEALAQIDAYSETGSKDADPAMIEKFRAKLNRHVSN
jgi:tetratricopeptide (TPR) repeat protein